MNVLSLIGSLFALVGLILVIVAIVRRNEQVSRPRIFIVGLPAASLLPGILLFVFGGLVDGVLYKNQDIHPLSVFSTTSKILNRTATIEGTIAIPETPSWPLLRLAPGQVRDGEPIQGDVLLLKDRPSSSNNSDEDSLQAAYNYFSQFNGAHCSLTGKWKPDATVRTFKVESPNCTR